MTNNYLHVIFGSGPVGIAVASELTRRGERVKIINRSGEANAPDRVQVEAGNVFDHARTQKSCENAKVVYMCAQPEYTEWPEKFPPMLANVLDAAAVAGAKFIMADNLYMYGETNGPLHEGLPLSATTRKGRVRAQMDEAIMAAHADGKVRAAIGHASDFYGPGVFASALGERAIIPALQGKSASLGGNLDVPHTFTYVNDFGKGLVILGERDDALGQHWNIPSPPTLTQRQLMTLFFAEIGRPPRISSVSKTMMWLAGLFIPAARETVEMMYEFEKPFVMDDSKFKRAFGDIATSQNEAIKATVAWYRAYLKNRS